MTHEPEFERLIGALRPWLDQVVIVGGWAHRLHLAHPLAQAPAHEPVRTRDADVAFGGRARLSGRIAACVPTMFGRSVQWDWRHCLRTTERPA